MRRPDSDYEAAFDAVRGGMRLSEALKALKISQGGYRAWADRTGVMKKANNALVAAGHSWAQPRVPSESEKFDAAKIPREWISAPKERPRCEQHLVRIRRLDLLAVRFAPLSMMRGGA